MVTEITLMLASVSLVSHRDQDRGGRNGISAAYGRQTGYAGGRSDHREGLMVKMAEKPINMCLYHYTITCW